MMAERVPASSHASQEPKTPTPSSNPSSSAILICPRCKGKTTASYLAGRKGWKPTLCANCVHTIPIAELAFEIAEYLE